MPVSQIRIAENGPTLSRIVWGLWRLKDWNMTTSELLNNIHRCIDLGITTFDHADIYGDYTCEQLFGKALAKDPSLRSKIQIVTKCGVVNVSPKNPGVSLHHYDTGKKHILSAVDESRKNFRTDYLDLLLIHRPDPLMNADETAAAFTELKQSEKVRYFGVSNFKPWQYDLLASRLDFPLVTNQVEFSVMSLDVLLDGTIDQCQRLRISPMAWSPFAGGRLFTAQTSQAIRLRNTIDNIREMIGALSIDQVALAWILNHPARIIPILGSGTMERLIDTVEAESMKLSTEQWFMIWCASTGNDVP